MSGHPQGGGILTIFATLLVGIYDSAKASHLRGAARRAQDQAAWDARTAEREARKQHQKWFEQVERQMARGEAGDASQQEAAAALRGRGGRPNKLDDQWF